MNSDWVEFHLEEAILALTALRQRVVNDELDMGEVDLGTSIAEVWGHLNAAWRGRDDDRLHPTRIADLSDDEWRRLRSGTTDLNPI